MADLAAEILSDIPELIIHKPQGAFYMTVVFKEGVLHSSQKLSIPNSEVGKYVESLITSDFSHDKRFVYYLLASTGLCVVPLMSGFNSTYYGFRFTVLDPNMDSFKKNIETLRDAVKAYLAS
jgi:aspartate/methionine/tyrosine aminotransferase